jgi:hypothetical protein
VVAQQVHTVHAVLHNSSRLWEAAKHWNGCIDQLYGMQLTESTLPSVLASFEATMQGLEEQIALIEVMPISSNTCNIQWRHARDQPPHVAILTTASRCRLILCFPELSTCCGFTPDLRLPGPFGLCCGTPECILGDCYSVLSVTAWQCENWDHDTCTAQATANLNVKSVQSQGKDISGDVASTATATQQEASAAASQRMVLTAWRDRLCAAHRLADPAVHTRHLLLLSAWLQQLPGTTAPGSTELGSSTAGAQHQLRARLLQFRHLAICQGRVG